MKWYFDLNILRSCCCWYLKSTSFHYPILTIEYLEEHEFQDTCPICYISYMDDLDVICSHSQKITSIFYYRFPCKHLIHKDCFEKYVNYKTLHSMEIHCPFCRYVLMDT